jgi:hypothetical protein
MEIGESHARIVEDVVRFDRPDRFIRNDAVPGYIGRCAGCNENASRLKEYQRDRIVAEGRSPDPMVRPPLDHE